jgi:hypothetical protein
MTRYLLDNGILIAYLKGRPGALRLVQPWIMAREATTSQLVYGEAIEYLKGAPDYRQRRTDLCELLLERYADLRRDMRRSVGLIGDIDTLRRDCSRT